MCGKLFREKMSKGDKKLGTKYIRKNNRGDYKSKG